MLARHDKNGAELDLFSIFVLSFVVVAAAAHSRYTLHCQICANYLYYILLY